jgi:hypothetical protein
MSLTNPAFAAVNGPADAELTVSIQHAPIPEETFSGTLN